MKYIITLLFAMFLSACNSHVPESTASFSGTYSSTSEKSTITFTPDGKARWDGRETAFTTDGNAVKLQLEGGLPVRFVKNSDGSLSLNGSIKFKKE